MRYQRGLLLGLTVLLAGPAMGDQRASLTMKAVTK